MSFDRASSCPVCLGRDLHAFLARDNVPIFANVLFKYRSDALNVDRGSLRLMACTQCGFVFNAAFDSAVARYSQRYDNNQTFSTEFSSYAIGHIRRLVDEQAVRDCTVVEVGCGNGWFLEHLVAASPNSTGFGFDPAYRGPEHSADGRIHFARRNFRAADATLKADVVVCRHVIEHVADPVALLSAVRDAVRQSQKPRVFFETPSIEWILRNQVVWDFFYEHCSYFSPQSLQVAFNRAGFSVKRVEHVFGDQYLWLEATVADQDENHTLAAREVPALATLYGESEPNLRRHWETEVRSIRKQGKVAVWGAGAKGVTFLNLFDPGCCLVECAVDVSPEKQGLFVGGTGHAVVGVEQLAARDVKSALLMNPNYRQENLQLLKAANAEVRLIG
jgi:SAM-dependent methyltransferase